MKHPWEAKRIDANRWCVYDAEGMLVANNLREAAKATLIAASPDLLAMVRRYASECAECNGSGIRMMYPSGAQADCADCADIRALITKAAGDEVLANG